MARGDVQPAVSRFRNAIGAVALRVLLMALMIQGLMVGYRRYSRPENRESVTARRNEAGTPRGLGGRRPDKRGGPKVNNHTIRKKELIMELKINVVAVLVAVAVNFVIGFAWYGALFAKPWGKEMGYDPNMRPDKRTMLKGMAFMIIGNFLFAWVLAFYLAGWQYIPGAKEMGPLASGVNSAISVWVGFYLPVHLSRIVWEKHSWKLFSINSGYHLVATTVVAVILSSWT